jgi:hypothetical protein
MWPQQTKAKSQTHENKPGEKFAATQQETQQVENKTPSNPKMSVVRELCRHWEQ